MSQEPVNPGPFPFPAPSSHQHDSARTPPPKRERDLFGKEPPGELVDWSHRKGEPRVFAVLWMIFLLSSTAMMFARLSTGYTISPSVSSPAAREMLVLVVFGMSILWPMVRFSQKIARPSIVAASIRDMIVVLIPLQAVIWPQRLVVLGGWTLDVVAAMALHTFAWGLVIAGLISIGSILIAGSSNDRITRMWMMLGTALVVFMVPVIELVTLKGAPLSVAHANLGWMLSPVTGILEITANRNELGRPAMVFGAHFRIITAVGLVGIALLLFARSLENAKWVARRRIQP
ncbi:MAG: hypothetical protein AB8C13_07695 [Phycisphaerales bacterium]